MSEAVRFITRRELVDLAGTCEDLGSETFYPSPESTEGISIPTRFLGKYRSDVDPHKDFHAFTWELTTEPLFKSSDAILKQLGLKEEYDELRPTE